MLEKISNIKKKISDKLIVGAVTLDLIIKNSSLDLAEETEKAKDYTENGEMGFAGLAIGGLLCFGGRTLKEKGYDKLGNLVNYAGFGVIGGTTVAYFLI